MTAPDRLLDISVRDLAAKIAAETPSPASGSTAAVVVMLAAALVAMSARFSRRHWQDAAGVVAQAEALRKRASPLAQLDAEAYEAVLAVRRAMRSMSEEDRDAALGRALSNAADVPLAIAEAAADVAELAALVAEKGNPNVAGDAAAAAALAEGAARAAATLVAINLGTTAEDERAARAQQLVRAAEEAMRRALAAAS
jgi:formiminotetrahydrofolate cyclodeaminase